MPEGRALIPASVAIMLAGCCALGPCDGLFSVSGVIDGDLTQPCLLDVTPEGAGPSQFPKQVSGNFEEGFLINPSRMGHRILVTCEGKIVVSRLVHYGKDVDIGGVVALGEIAL
jgi:hypothetical protein